MKNCAKCGTLLVDEAFPMIGTFNAKHGDICKKCIEKTWKKLYVDMMLTKLKAGIAQ